MVETSNLVKCPHCGHESPYYEDVYDGRGFEWEVNAVFETEVMLCKECGKKYLATVKYVLESIVVKESE